MWKLFSAPLLPVVHGGAWKVPDLSDKEGQIMPTITCARSSKKSRLKPQTTTLCTTAVAAWSQQPKNGERKQRKKACKNEGKLSVVFTYFLNKVF